MSKNQLLRWAFQFMLSDLQSHGSLKIMKIAHRNLSLCPSFAFTPFYPAKDLSRWEFIIPTLQSTTRPGRWTNLYRAKELLSRSMSAWRWRWNVTGIRERGYSKKGWEETAIGHGTLKICRNRDPNIRQSVTWRFITHLLPSGTACFKGQYGNCSSLAVPFVGSHLSRTLWLSIGCFANSKCFSSDLMINMVHYSNNLPKQMLKLPFSQVPEPHYLYINQTHHFWCPFCTKHSRHWSYEGTPS